MTDLFVINEYEGSFANKRQLFGIRGIGETYNKFWKEFSSKFKPTYDNDDFPWSYVAFDEEQELLFRETYKNYIQLIKLEEGEEQFDCVLDIERKPISPEALELNRILIEEIQKEINKEIIKTICENSK